jgi:hypothetical protein
MRSVSVTKAPGSHRNRWLRIGVPLGAGLFMLALAGSAAVVPALRPLHFFQALIYVAVVLLARRGSAWGLGAGVVVPLFWNVSEWFGPRLVQAGAEALWVFVSTGHAHRIDAMMVPLGWIGHCVLITSCVIAFIPRRSDWKAFAGGGAISLAYFALIVATLLPG